MVTDAGRLLVAGFFMRGRIGGIPASGLLVQSSTYPVMAFDLMLTVPQLIAKDQWTAAEIQTDSGWALLRFRTPVLTGSQTAGYSHLLRVVWIYDEAGSGSLPPPEASTQMATFEDRICDA